MGSSAAVGAAGSSGSRSSDVAVDVDSSSSSKTKIRIAQIAGRFLVFDVADVARLRREQSMCSILVGITPQAPNQTVFSSLPLELTADEVRWLVYDRRAAYVVDDVAAHVRHLAQRSSRRAYADEVLAQRRAAQAVADEAAAERERRGAQARAKKGGFVDAEKKTEKKEKNKVKKKALIRITPTTSAGLVDSSEHDQTAVVDIARYSTSPSATALRAHLADRGYYTTPGLRFGGQLSVYPGDPFRYHAHFVASSYDWEQPICLLDIVGTGRLATGVKKGLLIGGAKPVDDDDDDSDKQRLADNVRTFTLEWAAI